jgi:hypothetical protein
MTPVYFHVPLVWASDVFLRNLTPVMGRRLLCIHVCPFFPDIVCYLFNLQLSMAERMMGYKVELIFSVSEPTETRKNAAC